LTPYCKKHRKTVKRHPHLWMPLFFYSADALTVHPSKGSLSVYSDKLCLWNNQFQVTVIKWPDL